MDMILNCILNNKLEDVYIDIYYSKISVIYRHSNFEQKCIYIYQDCFCDLSFQTVSDNTKIVWLK